jgi:hypothetical protein
MIKSSWALAHEEMSRCQGGLPCWGFCPTPQNGVDHDVADHAENLGLAPMIAESNPDLLKNPWSKKVHDLVKSGKGLDAFNEWIAAPRCWPPWESSWQ